MAERGGAVEERWVRLELNGRSWRRWTASPGHADALAAGRLLAEGVIGRREELLGLSLLEAPGETVVRARVPEQAAARALERRAAQLSGEEPPAPGPPPRAAAAGTGRAPLPPLDAFPPLFRQLFASAELYPATGGLHSAALSDGARLLQRVEEVGRHNAVDKVVGLALLAGADLATLGLVISARVSGEMAAKAVAAGLAWIASRSVPTTLALEVAGAAGLPIVARAAGKDAYVAGQEMR